MENENTDNIYFYDDKYYTLEELHGMYQKLIEDQKKPFRDSLAHFTLVEILKKCNYDERYINGIYELAVIESTLISLYGSDCGTPALAFRGLYNRNLRKLINLTGKLVSPHDKRIDEFENGEMLLNNLVCLTIGSSFEKDNIDDLFLVDYNSLSEEECLAIADNFVRSMGGEKIVFHDTSKRFKR